MYRFLRLLTPDDVEAIAAFAYMRCSKPASRRWASFITCITISTEGLTPIRLRWPHASRRPPAATGIGLTLLPALYRYGGFGGAAPNQAQKRFLNSPRATPRCSRARAPSWPRRMRASAFALHSLRAVTPEILREALAAHHDGPIHIHAAEQTKEVADCIAALKTTPVAWLMDNANVDPRWCLIHATHMTEDETRRLARTGAVAGLCPLTEASLGDGIFSGAEFFTAGGRFGVGTDSNIQIGGRGRTAPARIFAAPAPPHPQRVRA